MRGIIRACLTVVMSGVFSVAAYADATLRLTVQGPDGNALVEMPCELELTVSADADGRSSTRKHDLQTNAEGLLDVTVPPLARYNYILTVDGVGHAVFGPRFAPEDGQVAEISHKLTRSGCIMVRITRKDNDAPIANASAVVFPRDGGQGLHAQHGRSGKEGYCVIPDVPPGKWHLSVNAPDVLGFSSEVMVTGGDEVQRLEVQLARGEDLRGVVLLEDGETPAEGAEVSMTNRPNAIRTAADGHFSFDNVHPSLQHIRVWHEGFVKHETAVEVEKGNGAPPVKIILKNRGGSLSGLAENADEEEPMPGETVIAALYTNDNPDHDTHWFTMDRLIKDRLEDYESSNWFGMDYPRTVTDEAGRYEFKHIPGGKYLVCVIPKDMPGGRREGVIVEEGKLTENVTVQATAKPKGCLVLRFVNEKGEHLKGHFSFELRGDGYVSSGGISTDEEGRWYRLKNSREKKANLKVTGKGYLPVERELELKPDEFQEVLITMREASAENADDQAPGTLVGKALMPDEKTPAAGVLVIPFTQDAPRPGSEAGTGSLRFKEEMSVTTDENGAFRIANLEPGEYGVYLCTRTQTHFDAPLARPEFAECVGTLSPVVTVVANKVIRMPDVTFAKAAKLQIHVLDAETGKPLPEARCTFYETSRRGSQRLPFEMMHHNAESDEAGLVEFSGLRAGEYRLNVNCNDYGTESRSSVVLKEGKDVSIKIKLCRVLYGDITGVVRLPDGTPAEGAKVFYSGNSDKPTAIAGDEGRFHLEKQREGEREFYVTHPEFAPAKQGFKVVAGQTNEVAFNLVRGGILEARVLDAEGKPAGEDMRVVLAFSDRAGRSMRSLLDNPRQNVFILSPDDDGRVRFEHLPAWPITAFAVKDREVLSTRSDIEVAEGKTVKIMLSTKKERGVIEGRVLKPDGTPVEKARVHILNAQGNSGSQERVQTDAEGKFRAECLPRRWAVGVETVVEGQGAIVIRGRVDVKDGETTTVDFTLGPYGSVSGSISDAEGNPATSMRVATIRDEEDIMTNIHELPGAISLSMGRTDEEGRYTLKGLLPGEYNLYVMSRGSGKDTPAVATVRVEAGKDVLANIVLKE